MKKLKNFLAVNSSVVILCFFLPFLPPMCSGTESNEAVTDSEIAIFDSTESTTEIDSSFSETTQAEEAANSIISDSFISDDKSGENSFLDFIKSPDGKNLSGIGQIIFYGFTGFILSSLLFSFILIIISYFLRKNKTKSIIISSGLLFLIFFGYFNSEELKYGFWITLLFYFTNTIASWFIVLKEKKHNVHL